MTTLSTIRPRRPQLASLCCATLALAAGQALAQSSLLSCGLLHTATGQASISQSPTGRGVFVHNAGPHDGVSIQCQNTWGAGVHIDGSTMMQSDGLARTVSCTFVPWTDPCAGTPENCGITASVRNNGNNTLTINVVNSEPNDGYQAVLLDQGMMPIGTVPVPPGGLDFFYINCPDGTSAGHIWRTVWVEAQQKFVSILVWGCLGSLNLNNPIIPVYAVRFEPISPSSPNTNTGISRCVVTTEGVSDVIVSEAEVAIRPPANPDLQVGAAFATGGPGTILTSSCQADAACCDDCDDRDDSSLRASGVDDASVRSISIESSDWLGVSSTGTSEEAGLSFSQACTDCTNQTTTVSLRDDNGRSIGFSVTPLNADHSSYRLSYDFSELGSTMGVLRAYGADGVEVTPGGGVPTTDFLNFDPVSNPCPPGTIPTWTTWYKPGHGWITSYSCWINTNLVLPGGTVITGVAYISVGAADATMQMTSLDRCDLASSCDVVVRSFGPDPITGSGPTCDSIDFNNDTSMFDPQDIDAFLSVYGEGPCIPDTAACNDIDFNNDGSVFDPCDIDSFLVQFGEGPCTLCGT